MRKIAVSAAALALSAVSLTGCANEADAKIAAEGLAFFKSTEALCNEYAATLDKDKLDSKLFAKAVTEDVFTEGGTQYVQVVDGAGNLLFVNLTDKTVQGGTRPDEVMADPYLRSCPVDLYLGVSYELEYEE